MHHPLGHGPPGIRTQVQVLLGEGEEFLVAEAPARQAQRLVALQHVAQRLLGQDPLQRMRTSVAKAREKMCSSKDIIKEMCSSS